MLFLLTYQTSLATQRTGIERFKQSGGPPPDGVKMIGRWHALDGSSGAVICETNDAIALAKWAQEWADVISMHITPVADDEIMAKVMG
jgi:hypothetical protein